MSVVQAPAELVPYLEEGTERVLEANDLTGSFTLTCDLPVQRVNVELEGVTFSSFKRFTSGSVTDRAQHIRLINQHATEAVDDVQLVWNRSDGLDLDERCVWVMTDGEAIEYPHPFADAEASFGAETIRLPSDVYTYERVPFDSPVDSVTELEVELEKAMSEVADRPVSLSLD